jgi:hypothetical protein
VARGREKGRDAGAAGADALGKGALRRELNLKFAANVLALKFLVLTLSQVELGES